MVAEGLGPLSGDTLMRKTIWTTTLFLVLLFGTLCFAVPAGEFSYTTHRNMILFLYASLNNREADIENFKFKSSFGAGFALYYRLSKNNIGYEPHKILYLSLNNDFSGFLDKRLVYQFDPGFLVRTYIPFLKLNYGAGLNFKFGNSVYPPWGYYGTVGIDFHKFVINSRVIFHPNSNVVIGEIQLGILFSGKYK
jgi:hypothetical protein